MNLGPEFWASVDTVARQADARSAEIEELRRLPTDLADALIDTGVFKMWVPGDYGGAQASVAEVLDAIERTAYWDGAAGWAVMIANTTALNSGYLPPRYGQEIFGDPRSVACGYGMPAGVGRAVDGGIVVSGRWQWGSGSSFSTSIGGGVRIVEANSDGVDKTVKAPFVFFDRADVELLDTWHVAGLKGTGSGDYTVTEAFVPEGRWVSFVDSPEPVVDSPLYRFSFLGALGLGVSMVAAGLARRAVDELVALSAKVPAGSSKGLGERAPVQADLAAAEAAYRSARALVDDTVGRCWDEAAQTGTMAAESKRLLRLAANNAVERAAFAVDLCYTNGGGSAAYLSSPLQRVFRDIHVATQHGMVAPRLMEPLGRMKFGLPTSTAQF